ncbi:MAG: MarR family winged helix-turn-helix transcriptional regulator [Actinomycetota bacterium]|jgi:DNA-binding MarR family transcriptional regulator|nr:MarR family winged helix-turn-helix transcriptional regulator [Actinomycetota bacterium]
MAQVNSPVMTTDEKSAAAALRVTIARIYRALRLSAASGITPSQVSVLFRVEQCEPVRMGILAHLEAITPATLSKVVDSLEALELVEREPDPLDGRVTLIRVSTTGHRLIEAQRAATTRALEEALGKMEDSHRELLLESLPALEGLAEILLTRDENL